jgi:zinc protease
MNILTTLTTQLPFLIVAVIISLNTPAFAQKQKQQDTHEYLLKNGLRVIIKEDHRAPTVAHMVWYKAGSIDEVNGKTGVAHVLEHMMFKGTKNLKPGEFSKKVAEVGGRDNAFTSKDYTAYFQQIEKSHLSKMMALEADRMENLRISPEEFAKEIQVVMEERRLRTDDNSQALVYEQLMAAAYVSTPYRNPIVGWMDDLKSLTYQDALDWYQNWYAPNNAVLIVVGDVVPEEVLALAKKYYENIPSKKIQERKPQNEIQQIGLKKINVKVPAENADIHMAWKVPKLEPKDLEYIEPYALSVLSAILDGHSNSRLNRKLVRDQRIANSVSSSYDLNGRGPQLFSISATPTKNTGIDALEKNIRKILNEVKENGVTDVELNRVKSQLLSSQIYKRDSIFAQAMEIGMSEMEGFSWRDLDKIIANVQKVSSKDIQSIIQKYLIDDQLTIAILDPQPVSAQAPKQPGISGMRH